MDFLDKRIQVICDELKKLCVKQKETTQNLVYKEGFFLRPEEAANDSTPFEPFDIKTMHWYGPDKHYWFKCEYTVSPEMNGKSLWFHLCTQINEWDDAKNPQFLMFINGEVVQGVDMNHRYVLIDNNAVEGTKYEIELQAYTGILHDEFNLIADVCEVDPEIKGLYYDLEVPLSAFPRLDKESKSRMDLERVLNDAINLLDLRTPYSDAFYASVKEAREFLAEELYTKLAGHDEVIATCIGHTHIDVAWWWTVAQTREKVVRSFSTVLKLMEEYPNYKFMSSQPQLYAFLKERYPELFEKVKDRVKEGRWEPEGGMWVEADCNLTSGESLARQFLYGKRFFKEEFGLDNKILWLPDVFGYSGALPQIMKKSGIDYFMTTKLAWNQFNKMPYDTFNWKGIDGTEILTHLVTTLGVGQSENDFFTTYNGMLHPDAIIGGWKRYQNKDINNDILISYGYGDGGGGPTREMLETSMRMEKGVTGLPKVRQEFSRTFFDELNERVKDHKRLPTWEGELYFEYHRGTYTSMARNKRSNRKSEFGMMDLELISVLADKMVEYPYEDIDKLWHGILINQFHDILPGSSIKEVYEVTKREYEEYAKKINELKAERVNALTPASDNVTIYNTTGFERDDVVSIGDIKAEALMDESGKVYPVQATEDGSVVYVNNLPSKGYKTFKPVASTEAKSAFELKDNFHLETPFYTVELDENGMLKRLFDKSANREVMQANKVGNLFRMYEDKPIYYDNWDIDIYYTEKFWDVTDITRMEWVDVGAVSATLLLERHVSNSVINQKIHFYANSRRIDFETVVDWKEHQNILKVHFPVNVHTDEATFEIQFGNLKRKTHTNTSWDKARFESCGQKWVDVSEGHYGVSLLNDCKYGHSIKDSVIGLTLIKSGIEPNPTTDQEIHTFTYSLYPHTESWTADGTVKEAFFVNQPAFAVKGGNENECYSLASVNAANVILETVKQAEDKDGYVVRVYECENSLTPVTLKWNRSFTSAVECNLIEETEENSDVTVNGDEINFTIKPYEVKSIRIK